MEPPHSGLSFQSCQTRRKTFLAINHGVATIWPSTVFAWFYRMWPIFPRQPPFASKLGGVRSVSAAYRGVNSAQKGFWVKSWGTALFCIQNTGVELKGPVTKSHLLGNVTSLILCIPWFDPYSLSQAFRRLAYPWCRFHRFLNCRNHSSAVRSDRIPKTPLISRTVTLISWI